MKTKLKDRLRPIVENVANEIESIRRAVEAANDEDELPDDDGRPIPPVHPDTVIDVCARAFGCSPLDIKSPARAQPVADARACVSFFLVRHIGMKLQEVGRILNRHHSAIIHGVRKVEELILRDRMFAARFAIARHELKTILSSSENEVPDNPNLND